MDFSLSLILAQIIAYLTFIVVIAGSVQTAVNQFKPVFLTPLKERFEEEGNPQYYVITIYVVRFILTLLAVLSVPIDSLRAMIPAFEIAPDLMIQAVTVFLIVMGEEVIHELIDKISVARDTIENSRIN